VGVASGIVGGGTIINSIKDYTEKRAKLVDLNKKPVALLFDAKNKLE
jgi:hypothetical protein